MATEELAAKLNRRNLINEVKEGSAHLLPSNNIFNPYTEFKEFSRKQIQDFQKIFNKYDVGNDRYIDLMELKLMMEKLGAPQTHISLKNMIREVDEDHDDKISFREFLLIFRKAAAGDLQEGSGLYDLYKNMDEIDVDVQGVKEAKNFFQAKIEQQAETGKFEREIREEQEEKKRLAEEAKERKKAFLEKASIFNKAAK
ncbi:unnamed protein product [Candidula unifasciata]|uniref:EF-hand domain-containing protein n=1 Tax=Candidula unifasciata TaxID=100452 RepID=A0A8S3ZLN3_9EUPU|nr:unnamed protein product [Candidula unifasciata]